MFFKKAILLLLCFVSPFFSEGAFAQINLVPNPSFENIYSCPYNYYIDTAVGWSTPKNGGGGAPDLYNECASGTIAGVPVNNNNLGFQNAHSGKGYAGIGVASSNQPIIREYIQCKLKNKLKAGNNYCITFYVSFFNQCLAYIKPMGAYLDSGNVYAPTSNGLAIANPQIYNTGQQLSDTLNWMQIEGSFVAAGIETYITLGNFFTDAGSDIGFIGTPTFWSSYYYIDDVSVIDISTPAFSGNDTIIIPGDSVFIGRPPEVGLNEDCIWFVNNQPIDTVAGMWVKPTITTTYVLQQSICGTVTYDSVKINISGVGVNELNNNGGLEIYPNPVNSSITIEFKNKNVSESDFEIINMLGQVQKINVELKGTTNTINIEDLPAGIYFIKAINKINGLVSISKFVKE